MNTTRPQSPIIRRRDWLLAFLLSAPPAVLLPYLAHDTYSPAGSETSGELVFALGGMAILMALAFLAMAGSLVFSKRTRPWAGRLALNGSALLAATFAALLISDEIRDAGLRRFASEAEPLVVAIRTYSERHGVPPPSLDALVPEYIPAIPKPGIPAARKWSYSIESYATGLNSWTLTTGYNYAIGEVTYVPVPDIQCRGGARTVGGTWCHWGG